MRDPGLQPERTALARQRTVLSVVLGCLVLALGQLRHGSPLLATLAAILALMTAVLAFGRPPHHTSDVYSRPGPGPWPHLSRTVGVVVLLAGLACAASITNLLR